MSVSHLFRYRHGHRKRWPVSPVAFSVLACALVLAVGSAGQVAAQQSMSRELFTPFADALGASSWLLVTEQDPRYPDPDVMSDWGSGNLSVTARSTSAQPQSGPGQDQIVSQQLGLVPVTSDPSLAVDPGDANHLVLAASALDLPSIVTYVTFDGGKTWDGPRQAPHFPLDTGSLGAPVVMFDSQGTLYLASRSVAFASLQIGEQHVQDIRTRIVVATSDDGGLSWNEPISAVLSSSDVTTASDETGQSVSSAIISFLDWPSLLIAPDPQQPERPVLYLTYTEFRAHVSALNAGALAPSPVESKIRLVRSSDGGATWSDPIDVSPAATLSIPVSSLRPSIERESSPSAAQSPIPPPTPPAPLPAAEGHQVVQGGQAVALADGTLLVAYFDSTADGPRQGLARIMAATSSDGGRTFTAPTPSGIFHEIGATPRTAFLHWWSSSFPRVSVDADDTILIATTARPAARPSDDADVVLLRSTDGGASWEPSVTLGDDSSGNQFFPAIAAADDGTLHAIWSDTRDDPHGVSFSITHAQSHDGGATWNVGEGAESGALSGEMSNTLLGFPGGIFLGDSTALAVSGGRINAAWPDTRLATVGAPNQQIGFVSVSIAPSS